MRTWFETDDGRARQLEQAGGERRGAGREESNRRWVVPRRDLQPAFRCAFPGCGQGERGGSGERHVNRGNCLGDERLQDDCSIVIVFFDNRAVEHAGGTLMLVDVRVDGARAVVRRGVVIGVRVHERRPDGRRDHRNHETGGDERTDHVLILCDPCAAVKLFGVRRQGRRWNTTLARLGCMLCTAAPQGSDARSGT